MTIIKSYIKFILHSKNEHGIHSPFVFDLVTKCFYSSNFIVENTSFLTTNKLILKTIHYLNLENCVRFDVEQELNTAIDGLLVSGDSIKDFSIEKILPFCTNDTCIFVEHIHQTKENEKIWKQLHQQETITCSIETFNLGFLFIRKEQKKEHFIINPNKTITSRIFERIRF